MTKNKISQKQKIIETYKRKDVVESFDITRNRYLSQKFKHKIEANFLKKAIKELKIKRVRILDVGCGTGRMLPEIFSIKKDITYYGLDTSERMLKILRKKAKYLGINKNVKIKIGGGSSIPFKDEKFDIVFSYHLLWHLPKKEQRKIIKEMLRVCKKNSFVILDALNKNFVWEKFKIFLGKKTKELFKVSVNDIKNVIGNKEFKIEKLNDFPIKNDLLYRVVNVFNLFRKILPVNLFHMIYFKVKK